MLLPLFQLLLWSLAHSNVVLLQMLCNVTIVFYFLSFLLFSVFAIVKWQWKQLKHFIIYFHIILPVNAELLSKKQFLCYIVNICYKNKTRNNMDTACRISKYGQHWLNNTKKNIKPDTGTLNTHLWSPNGMQGPSIGLSVRLSIVSTTLTIASRMTDACTSHV